MSQNHRLIPHIILLGFLLSLFSVCGCQSSPSSVETEEPEPLVIGILPDVESIPLVIAEKNGYFEEAGANVQLEMFQSARDRDSALQGHQLDGVISDMIAVVFAQTSGFPLKITAQTDGNILLLSSPEMDLTSIEELVGKEVALSTNTVMEYSLDQMLMQAGIDPKSILKTAVPQLPTRLEMLQNGQLDAAILPQPLAGIALINGSTLLCDTQQLGEKAGVIAFTDSALEEKAEAIQGFFTAYNQAILELNQSEPGNYNEFLIETLSFPEEFSSDMFPDYQLAHLPQPEIFSHVIDWMIRQELITEELNFEDVAVDIF